MASEIENKFMMDICETNTITVGLNKKRRKRPKVKLVCDKENPIVEVSEEVQVPNKKKMEDKKFLKKVQKKETKNAEDTSSVISVLEVNNLIYNADRPYESSEPKTQLNILQEQDPDSQVKNDDQSVGIPTKKKVKISNNEKNALEVKSHLQKNKNKHTSYPRDYPLLKGIINSKIRHKPDKNDTIKIMELKRAAGKRKVSLNQAAASTVVTEDVTVTEDCTIKDRKRSSRKTAAKEIKLSNVSTESTETSAGARVLEKQVRTIKNPVLLADNSDNGQELSVPITDELFFTTEIKSRRSKKKELKKSLKKMSKKTKPIKNPAQSDTYTCSDEQIKLPIAVEPEPTVANKSGNDQNDTQKEVNIEGTQAIGANKDNISTAEGNYAPNRDKKKKTRKCRRRKKDPVVTYRVDIDEGEQDVIDNWENINTDDIVQKNTTKQNVCNITSRCVVQSDKNDDSFPGCSYNLRSKAIKVKRVEILEYKDKYQEVKIMSMTTSKEEIWSDHNKLEQENNNLRAQKPIDRADGNDQEDDTECGNGDKGTGEVGGDGGNNTGDGNNTRDNGDRSNNDVPERDEPIDDQPGEPNNASGDGGDPPGGGDDGSKDNKRDDDDNNGDDNEEDEDEVDVNMSEGQSSTTSDEDTSDNEDYEENTDNMYSSSDPNISSSNWRNNVINLDDENTSNENKVSTSDNVPSSTEVKINTSLPVRRRINVSGYNALKVFRKSRKNQLRQTNEPTLRVTLLYVDAIAFASLREEYMYHIRVYHSKYHKKKSNRFNCVALVDSRMDLRKLNYHLPCLLVDDVDDVEDIHTVAPSKGYFAINGVLYMDMRSCINTSINEVGQKWTSILNLPQTYTYQNMDYIQLRDLPIELSMPYEWRHERLCSHTIIFSARTAYRPFDVRVSVDVRKHHRAIICTQCGRYAANYAVTAKHARLHANSGYLCYLCFNILLYEHGERAVDFNAYHIPKLNILPNVPYFPPIPQSSSVSVPGNRPPQVPSFFQRDLPSTSRQ